MLASAELPCLSRFPAVPWPARRPGLPVHPAAHPAVLQARQGPVSARQSPHWKISKLARLQRLRGGGRGKGLVVGVDRRTRLAKEEAPPDLRLLSPGSLPLPTARQPQPPERSANREPGAVSRTVSMPSTTNPGTSRPFNGDGVSLRRYSRNRVWPAGLFAGPALPAAARMPGLDH